MPNPTPHHRPNDEPRDDRNLSDSTRLPALPTPEGFEYLKLRFKTICGFIAQNAGVALQTPTTPIEFGQDARFRHGIQSSVVAQWKRSSIGLPQPPRFFGGIVWETAFIVTNGKPTFLGLLEIRNFDSGTVIRAPSGLLAVEEGKTALHFTSSVHGKPSIQNRWEPILPPSVAIHLCKAAHYARGNRRAPEQVGLVFDLLRLGVGDQLGIEPRIALQHEIDRVELTGVRGLMGAMHFDFRVFLAGQRDFYKVGLSHNAFGFLRPTRQVEKPE